MYIALVEGNYTKEKMPREGVPMRLLFSPFVSFSSSFSPLFFLFLLGLRAVQGHVALHEVSGGKGGE